MSTPESSHDKPFKSVHFSDSTGESCVEAKSRDGCNAIGRGCDTEAKSPLKDTNADKRSVNILNSRVDTNSMAAKSNVKKGTCAKFLRQNPRFVNEPICQVLPNESSASVGECLSWATPTSDKNPFTVTTSINGQTDNQEKPSKSHSERVYNSTCHSTYTQPSNDQRPRPLQKHHSSPKVDGIAPLINEQHQVVVKERISYAHQYNARTDPNEPIRGKLHGSFVWEPQKATKVSSS